MIITAEITGTAESAFKPDHQFVPWWSFGKTVLAAATFRLAEDRKLNLDAPLPDKPYTLRQLLAHRSGVPDYGGLMDYHAAVARGDRVWHVDELLERVHAKRLLFAPGQDWSYSNVGYLFVRQQIEQATGRTLNSVLREIVFAPLDIASGHVAESMDDMSRIQWAGTPNYNPGWVYHGLTAGTALDAARLLHRLFTSDFLKPDSKAAMLESIPLTYSMPDRPFVRPSPGTGLMIDPSGPHGFWAGHTGSGPGSVAAVYHFFDLLPPRTVAAFSDDRDEGGIERAVLALVGA